MSDKNKVIELSEHRKEKQEIIRREYERFLFEYFIACSLILENNQTILIFPEDISKSGMKFSPEKTVDLKNGDLVTLRVYFTHHQFIDHEVKIVRSETQLLGGVEKISFACKFDTQIKSYETIGKLIELIESFSSNAQKDKKERFGV